MPLMYSSSLPLDSPLPGSAAPPSEGRPWFMTRSWCCRRAPRFKAAPALSPSAYCTSRVLMPLIPPLPDRGTFSSRLLFPSPRRLLFSMIFCSCWCWLGVRTRPWLWLRTSSYSIPNYWLSACFRAAASARAAVLPLLAYYGNRRVCLRASGSTPLIFMC